MLDRDLYNRFTSLVKHPGFRRYLANTSWLMIERAIRLVATLLITIYVARYLGPDGFGALSYAISLVGLFSVIATLGLDDVVIRDLVDDPARSASWLGTAFVLKMSGAIVVMVIIMIVSAWSDLPDFERLMTVFIAAGLLFESFSVIDLYFRSLVLSKYVVYARIVQLCVATGLRVMLILIEAPLVAFAAVIAVDAFILASGLLCTYMVNRKPHGRWHFDRSLALRLLRNSWPLLLSGVAVSLYMRIDQVMLKFMMGTSSVGYYAAAVRLSEAWYFLPMVITTSLFPASIQARKVDRQLFHSRQQRLYDLMVWLSVGVALPVTFLAPWIIALVYGEVFSSSAIVLSVHIWASVFVFLGVASSQWLVAENLQLYSLLRTGTGAMTNIALNFILIPAYGIVGAAYASLISYVVATYISLLPFRETRVVVKLMTNSILPWRPFRSV